MPEQEHEYHPAVEEVMETSGPDIGRIKDQDVARKVGETEDNMRFNTKNPDIAAYPYSEGQIQDTVESQTKRAIAREAVKESPITGQLAADALHNADGVHERDEGYVIDAANIAIHEGKKAIGSYDQLQKDIEETESDKN